MAVQLLQGILADSNLPSADVDTMQDCSQRLGRHRAALLNQRFPVVPVASARTAKPSK